MSAPSFSNVGNIVIAYVGNKRYEYVVDLGAFVRVRFSKRYSPFDILNWLKNNNSCWRRSNEQWQKSS